MSVVQPYNNKTAQIYIYGPFSCYQFVRDQIWKLDNDNDNKGYEYDYISLYPFYMSINWGLQEV